jgi:hypothetical protein
VNSTVPFWHFGEGYSKTVGMRRSWLAYRNVLRYGIKNESLWQQFRLLGMLMNVGINPFRRESEAVSDKRLRAHNPLMNALLLAGAVVWNLFKLPQTLHARRHPIRLCDASARAKNGQQG